MNSRTLAATLSTLVVASSVVGGVGALVTGTATATQSAEIRLASTQAGATTTHTVDAAIESDDGSDSFSVIEIRYDSANTGNIGLEDVSRVGLDTDGDDEIEKDLSEHMSKAESRDNEHTIKFAADGGSLDADANLIIEYSDVVNPPEPGTYGANVTINPGSTDHPSTAAFEIGGTPLQFTGGSADPSQVAANTTVSDQTVTANFSGVSTDGNPDTVRMRFPNELAASLSVNSAGQSGSGGLASSATLVDGDDGDGVEDTVEFQTNTGSDGDTTSMSTWVDVEIDYDVDAGEYPVTATIEDSDGETASGTAASITVESTAAEPTNDATGGTTDDDDGVVPMNDAEVERFRLKHDGGDIYLLLVSTERLESIDVAVTGSPTTSLDRDDFEEEDEGATIHYTADIEEDRWGSYTADLRVAESVDGDDAASGQQSHLRLEQPSIEEFELDAEGRDVDLVMRAGSEIDDATVRVEGGVNETFELDDFDGEEDGGQHVYRTDVSDGKDGEFNATLTSINGIPPSDGAVAEDTIVVDTTVSMQTMARAIPNTTGATEAKHRYVVRVPSEGAANDNPLSELRIDYANGYLDADGQISSASDEQNVVTLRVVARDGTVKTELGDSDDVETEVNDGELVVDLSEVDDSETPTLRAGDRVVVALTPVTNADRPDEYEIDVEFTDRAGESTSVTAMLDVRPPHPQDVTATPTTAPAETPTAQSAQTQTPTPTDSDSPGFGAAVALAALVVTALLAVRWND